MSLLADWHCMRVEEVLDALGSKREGLSEYEAKSRLERFGRNVFGRATRRTSLRILFNQFRNLMVFLLAFSSIVSFLLGEVLDAVFIMIVVLVNIVAGFLLEYKSEKSFERLMELSPDFTLALREGRRVEVNVEELVPGDIVLLEVGDRVPADLRLFEANRLIIDESVLTGESVSSLKHVNPLPPSTPLADRENMAFAGTYVVQGSGKGVVVATGADTEFGRIAGMVGEETEESLLFRKLKYLGKVMFLFSALLSGVIIVVGITRGESILGLFIYAVGLLVSAIPEALPTVVLLSLAMAALKMATNNSIVRRLPVMEALGAVSFICSDKTGTITKNEMTVKKVVLMGEEFEVTGEGYEPVGHVVKDDVSVDPLVHEGLYMIITAGALCNNTSLIKDEKTDSWKIIGDPTEGAVMVLAHKTGIYERVSKYHRIYEIPFDSDRKRRCVVYNVEDELHVYVMGAPEKVLEISNRLYIGGSEEDFSRYHRLELFGEVERLARKGYRVLGVAFKKLDSLEGVSDYELESGLTFLGLFGLLDPPRKSVKRSIEECKRAGIKVAMITGDHRLTAAAVGRMVGLEGEVLDGSELDELADKELVERVDEVAIYARTTPSQKVRIIEALKYRGYVVAVTGDGVNDSPALKKAHVGIAMGITGSDVTKEAADIVLADDNFSTIVNAIRYGRATYINILKFIAYSLLGNFDELFIVIASFLAGLPFPLTTLQLLYINILTDGLPGLSLAFEKLEPNIMRKSPREFGKGILSKSILRAAVLGIYALIVELFLYFNYLSRGLGLARTVLFMFCVFYEIFVVFSVRRLSPFEFKPINKFLVVAVFVATIMQLFTFLNPLKSVLEVHFLNFGDMIIVLALAAFGFLFSEFVKLAAKKL